MCIRDRGTVIGFTTERKLDKQVLGHLGTHNHKILYYREMPLPSIVYTCTVSLSDSRIYYSVTQMIPISSVTV